MVKITNGTDVFTVTRGAFDGIYSRQGYTIVGKEEAENSKGNEGEVNPSKTEDEIFLEEIVEKPISQWNKEETKRFATLRGIDISGTKNVSEAKELIKEFLDNDAE